MSYQISSGVQAQPNGAAGLLRRSAGWVSQRLWLALPLLAIPALLPFVQIGLPGSADGMLHLLRLAALDQHIANGTLYPRWMPELYGGWGYPLFNFYGPFVYYLAEALHLLGLDFVSALIVTFAALMVASGFGMYRLALDVLGKEQRWAALVAATAYMVAPYLLTNVYVRGAVAEVGAQAWLPWVLWSVRRLLTEERPQPYVLAVALSLGGLATTHNITLLFTPLVLGGYMAVMWWQGGQGRGRLGWLAAGVAAAMGISAFFWLPLIGERRYLAESAYQIAATYLHENVWTWRNFLDSGFVFEHTFDVPFQLGLVQLALALIGLIAARRRDPEWLYFLALALLAALGISAWSLPLWLGSQLLLIAQFPWRLLAFMDVSLALFTGAILLPVARETRRMAVAGVLLVLIIVACLPRLDWMPVMAQPGDSVTMPAVSQFEYETGAMGTGSSQEFRPRWSSGISLDPSSAGAGAVEAAGERQITVVRATAYDIEAAVSASQGGPLRFTSLYFPGWQATLADGSALPTYPSTNLGFLTVELPPGDQQVTLRWTGTALQHLATGLSLATLALLAIFAWRACRPRWLAAVPLIVLAFGVAATLVQPAFEPVNTPERPLASRSMQLAGYRLTQPNTRQIYIMPYWYVSQTPPGDTEVRWQLRSAAGDIVGESAARPYFATQTASNWPPQTLVDDAYLLTLTPGLPSGSYQLAAQIAEGDDVTDWIPMDEVAVTAPVPLQPQPGHALDVRFGNLVRLAGFDLKSSRSNGGLASQDPAVVNAGGSLNYTLYWQALERLQTNYHSFIHLIDRQGEPLIKQDHLAGSFFDAPLLWDTRTLQPDRYVMRIPADTPSGLYWPLIGLYEFNDVQLLPVEDADGQPLGDSYRLPPIKVLGRSPSVKPQFPVSAHLGDLATLLGYDLALPEAGLRPGSRFDLTLYYQADSPTGQNLTQFAQLYNPDLGMAAQQDALPQDGANPTWAWAPGEIITDTRTLQVRADAEPGDYRLLVGLYDPADGTRLPVADAQGNPLPDGQITLTTLTVSP
ncbi:MAG: 6-pyruvoyl-tetrahydropterin synthase-related protein [Caldilineales bacterium]